MAAEREREDGGQRVRGERGRVWGRDGRERRMREWREMCAQRTERHQRNKKTIHILITTSNVHGLNICMHIL